MCGKRGPLSMGFSNPIYFFVSLDASAWTFLRSVCGSVRVAAMCSRTLSANAPFIGSLLDFTPSIAQIYSVANKTKIAETSKYTPADVLSETRLCRSQGCRIAHVRARMQHTPPCDGAYVALECTGGRFCYLGFGRFRDILRQAQELPGMTVNDCTFPRLRSNRQSPTGLRGARRGGSGSRGSRRVPRCRR